MPQRHIYAIAQFRARLDTADFLKSLLNSLLEPTRQEPGCVRYQLLQNREGQTEFTLLSEWKDEQSVQGHMASDYAQRVFDMLPDLLAVPMDIRFYHLID